MICKYCSAKTKYYDSTNHASEYKADVSIVAGPDSRITLYGHNRTYDIPIKFCPVCGRVLSKPPVRNTEQDYNNILCDNIKRAMAADKLTIDSVSHDTGISKTLITEYLAGNTENLSAGKVSLLADVLKTPVEKLFLPHGTAQTYEEALDSYSGGNGHV